MRDADLRIDAACSLRPTDTLRSDLDSSRSEESYGKRLACRFVSFGQPNWQPRHQLAAVCCAVR
jgi:hypothetical protein